MGLDVEYTLDMLAGLAVGVLETLQAFIELTLCVEVFLQAFKELTLGLQLTLETLVDLALGIKVALQALVAAVAHPTPAEHASTAHAIFIPAAAATFPRTLPASRAVAPIHHDPVGAGSLGCLRLSARAAARGRC